MGEIFYPKELGDDCAEDGVYEFSFAARRSSLLAAPARRSIRRRSN